MAASQSGSPEAELALVAEEVMAAIRELHEHGEIDDVFGRLPDEVDQRDAAPRGTAEVELPRYSMMIEWSDEDGVFVVSLPEWGDLVHTHGATYEDALQCGKDLIAGLVAARQAIGEPIPAPRVFAGV